MEAVLTKFSVTVQLYGYLHYQRRWQEITNCIAPYTAREDSRKFVVTTEDKMQFKTNSRLIRLDTTTSSLTIQTKSKFSNYHKLTVLS